MLDQMEIGSRRSSVPTIDQERDESRLEEEIAPASHAQGQWFGHPKGLSVLFATELWERFSYYGMRALLVLYMVDHLLAPGKQAEVLGLASLKRVLEAAFGPLGAQPLASQIYGLYTGFVYLTPILGGYLADRWLGRRRMVALGAALMVAGHFLMASEPFFLLALLLLILGNGAFKPNIVTQVGGLYAPGDARRDRAYSLFYVGINIGAFFSPLVSGTLGETLGWHYGFASAGVGMAIGLLTYLIGSPSLPADRPRQRKPEPASGDSARSRRALLGVLALFIPATLFFAAYEQQGNTIALWADKFTDRGVDLMLWKGEIPVTWFQAFNPLMVFLFTPLLVAFWAAQARRRREPGTMTKMAVGCFGVAFSYLIMALAAWINPGGRSSWLWLAAYFVVITFAELYFSPIALSLVSRIAPDHARSAMMGFWLTTTFAGNLLAGWIGGLWASLSPAEFFLVVCALSAAAGASIALARGPLEALTRE
jgi:proton-dependent oligopeptide transporter, POT family